MGPQKYSFRKVTALAEILRERIATVLFLIAFQFPGRTKSAGNRNFAMPVLFVRRKQIFY